MNVVRLCNHTFLADPLGPDSLVVDCGANRGEFSRLIAGGFGCRIEALEPDPQLFPRLPRIPRCTAHPLAVAGESGTAQFALAESMHSSLVFVPASMSAHVTVETITLTDFADLHALNVIDLLKLDVEGAELDILAGLAPSFLRDRVSQITVEFHEFLDPQSLPRIKATIDHVRRCGYHVFRFARTWGDTLLVNSARIPLSRWNRLQLLEAKYRHGLRRLVGRLRGTSAG